MTRYIESEAGSLALLERLTRNTESKLDATLRQMSKINAQHLFGTVPQIMSH